MTRVIRFVSNGHGEDAIACQLIPFFDRSLYSLVGFPLVGHGSAYKALNIESKLTQKQLPSGGFLRRPMDVIRDLLSGLLGRLFWQRRQLLESPSDLQIVVGDVFALVMACWGQKIPTIFLPTAKSERAIPHSAIELYLIKRFAKAVFPRDKETHDRMEERGILSYFFGNPMFDGIQSELDEVHDFIIGVLPGSRDEMVGNMAKILLIIELLRFSQPMSFIVALAPGVSHEKLQDIVNAGPWQLEFSDNIYTFFHPSSKCSVVISNQFYDVLHQSRLVIGLAGTANEQVMFANRPLISFIGTGPQSTKQRFTEQHQLIDGAETVFIDSNDPVKISAQINTILEEKSFSWVPLPPVQHVSSKIVQQLTSILDG